MLDIVLKRPKSNFCWQMKGIDDSFIIIYIKYCKENISKKDSISFLWKTVVGQQHLKYNSMELLQAKIINTKRFFQQYQN
jgi:hypothetical protein